MKHTTDARENAMQTMETHSAGYTLAADTLADREWFTLDQTKTRRQYGHAMHPGHVVEIDTRTGAWVHHSRYSTGYKIHARNVDAAKLAAHLDRSK